MHVIKKARSITDAEIQFISLVDKAANKKSFLITKENDGRASFSAYGKIIKTDEENHYVTGIVYEPMVEDSQGDFMTEEEIQKAAVWFAKNGDGIDLQHNFEKFENAVVVESMVAKSDSAIGNEKIKKGTWLMTVEISDSDVWSSIEKGEITGFSMGGKGVYREEETEPESISKSEGSSLIKKLAKMFGFEVVEKGEVAEKFKQRDVSEAFWAAFYSLQETLFKRDVATGESRIETDSDKIKESLADFAEIVKDILESNSEITKSDILNGNNIEKLKNIYKNTCGLLIKAGEMEESMTKAEVEALIKEAVNKANSGNNSDGVDDETKKFIIETVKKLISEQKKEEPVTKEEVTEMLAKAVEPIYKARGIATNLNNEPAPVEKEDDVFSGMFV